MFERMFLLLVISFITSLNGFQWRQLAASDLSNGPVGRTSPSNVLYQDAIIMYGGANHCGDGRSTYTDTWLFNITTLQWIQLMTKNDPPLGRWGHFAWIDPIFDPHSMLIFGGRYGENYTAQQAFSDVWRLDLKALTWSKLSDGIPGRTIMVNNNGAVTTPNGKVYFFNSNRQTTNSSLKTEVWMYQVQMNTFTHISTSPASSFVPDQDWLFSVLPYNSLIQSNDNLESLVVYGGWNQNQFYRFDLEDGVFRNLTAVGPHPPEPSHGHQALSVRSADEQPLYMIWGANNEPLFWFYSYANAIWTARNISSPPARLYTQTIPSSNSGSISVLDPVLFYLVAGHDVDRNICLSDVWILENNQH